MVTVSKKRTTPKNAAKKTVTKKTAVSAKKTATRKATKKSTSPSKPGTSSIDITPEERWKMIAVAAYHKAEKRGFAPGHELQDWAEAEKEIDKLVFG
jgi:hypothetical protein